MYKRKINIIPPELMSVASYGAAGNILDKAKKWLKGGGGKKKKGKKNPEEGGEIEEEVEKITKGWHGRGVKGTTEVVETETYQENLAELADLEELGILDENLQQYAIRFKRVETRPKLCASDENNLEIVGGDQKITVGNEGVLRDGKKLVPLGYSYSIVYETDKHHLEGSNGYPESYEHYWAEEFYKESVDPSDFKNMDDWFDVLMEEGLVEEAIQQGLLPMVVYNKTDEKIMLVGGKYEVTELGIKN